MADSEILLAARVIVSCDTSPLGVTAINAAASLARRLDAELTGIFVEDINLIRMAELPFTREVASASALPRPVQAGELQRLLAQQAQTVRDLLGHAASALSLPWSFQVVRGSPLDSVFGAMRGMDIAVFGHAGKYSASVTVGLPRAVMPRQSVMVVFDGTPAALRALAVAADIAYETHGRLVVAIAPAMGDAPALREQAQTWLKLNQKSNGHALFVTLKGRNADSAVMAAETYSPHVLLWGGVKNAEDQAALIALVDALRCPVILVN